MAGVDFSLNKIHRRQINYKKRIPCSNWKIKKNISAVSAQLKLFMENIDPCPRKRALERDTKSDLMEIWKAVYN